MVENHEKETKTGTSQVSTHLRHETGKSSKTSVSDEKKFKKNP